jgi:Predicted transcriptional regulator
MKNNLGDLLKQRKMSDQKLADVSGVSRGTITLFRLGKRDIHVTTLMALADGLQVTPNDILQQKKSSRRHPAGPCKQPK